MVQVDLITGFLGSGKTTFIKKYAKYLIDQGLHIAILENDFGAINVDMMVLEEELGDQCELEMVVGGGDLDCHRRRFKTKLISMGMRGFDRILVEPSGIYDVDEFFDVLHEEPLDKWYEIGNVIALVNSKLENNLSKQSDYLLGCQVADAGKIILSRSSEATEEEINNTITHLNNTMALIKCKRRFNRGTNMFNTEGIFKADTANQAAKMQAKNTLLQGTMQAERLRQAARQQLAAERIVEV